MYKLPRSAHRWTRCLLAYGVALLSIVVAPCRSQGSETRPRHLFTIPYGAGSQQVGYVDANEEGGPWTVTAWCLSPRRTLWLVDEVSGLAKEFSVEGSLLKTMPVLGSAWEKVLEQDEEMARRYRAAPGGVPPDLTLPWARWVAEDAGRRLFVLAGAGALLVLDPEGMPITSSYDAEGDLLQRDGAGKVVDALNSAARAIGWPRTGSVYRMQNDGTGAVYFTVSRPGPGPEEAVFRLGPDLASADHLANESAPSSDGRIVKFWREGLRLTGVDILSRELRPERSLSLTIPPEMFGVPSAEWKVTGWSGGAVLDRRIHHLLRGPHDPGAPIGARAVISFDAGSGAGVAWAKLPLHEKKGAPIPDPMVDPRGGIFALWFREDGLHVLHYDM